MMGLMNETDKEINLIIGEVKEKLTIMAKDEKRNDDTFSLREISDACLEAMHRFKIEGTSKLDLGKSK